MSANDGGVLKHRISTMLVGVAYFVMVLVPLLAGGNAGEETAVAIVDGQSISEAELLQSAGAQLAQLHLQEYEVKKEALQSLVDKKLIETEARRKGIPAGKLFEQEVDANAGEISNAELKAYYLAQKDRLNRPFAEVEQQLRSSLRESRIQQARQEYIAGLRGSAAVVILLRPPKIAVGADPIRTRGNRNAPVSIIEFSDFQCPFCQAAEAILKQVLDRYEGRVNLAYRDFPLTSVHPQAQLAAEASRCAAEGGDFWQYHDSLFADQSLLQSRDLIKTAGKLGLNETNFETCLASGKYREAVQSDYQEGLRAGVSGTPVFFINGIFLNGNQPFGEFAKIIDDELAAIHLQSQSADQLFGKEGAKNTRN